MQLNKEIFDVLKAHRIDRSQGALALLGIYFNLDIDSTCTEETVKAINLTKIVVKDYNNNTIQWNMPLFEGQETAFDWVADWIEPFGRLNPVRKGSARDATPRMKEFFKKYPEWRKDDVYKARDLYLSSVKDPQYLMLSHKFIFDGAGTMKKSTLLAYCERTKTEAVNTQLKGKIVS